MGGSLVSHSEDWKKRVWWFFYVEWYTFKIDTGDGEAVATIYSRAARVNSFEYYPRDERAFLLPLWAAYPRFTSVTVGWRQGSGERYKYRWHAFYRKLSEHAKAEYRRRFQPPDDEERCWHGFYELTSDKRATNKHPIADFIIGRVP